MVWRLQMPSHACVPQTADKRKQEVQGMQCTEAAPILRHLHADTLYSIRCDTQPAPPARYQSL